jgi:ERCC4-related helicase
MTSPFYPSGLPKNVFSVLHFCQQKAESITLEELLARAEEHVVKAYEAHGETGIANIKIADAIYDVFKIVVEEWENIPPLAKSWCKGMMLYFVSSDDDEDDFNSLIGFDDDVEVLNSCLVFARREDLCINFAEAEANQKIPKPSPKPKSAPSENPLTPGLRVLCRDAEWLVRRVDNYYSLSDGGKEKLEYIVHCVGVDDLVRGHQAIFLTQLDEIIPVDPRNTRLVADPSNGYKLSKLFLGAQLRQMPAAGIQPDLEGLGVFKAMNFQVETVARALKQLRPRLLLADAVGLGKTIQVGMILTELMRRGRANRILVLAKKSMLTQFQAELWNRFAIPLVRLDSAGIAKLRLRIPANKNPFEVYQRVIISIDTLKNVARYEHFLKDTRWDVVIIDEAHNVAGASVPEQNLSYRLARQLSRRADSILLTTATPHNGKRETFGRLISLLDPSVIPDPNFREYSAEDIKGFFLMRFKEDVRGDAGDLLTDREVVPIAKTTANATLDEETVYQILGELRQKAKQHKEGGGVRKGWLHHAMVQYVLYKLFLSSPEACIETIQKRLKELDDDRQNEEFLYLNRLENELTRLDIAKTSRYQLLKKQLHEIGWDGKSSSPRVLIFTESPRTQRALAPVLARDFNFKYSEKFESQPQQVLATINGSTTDIHLMKTVEAFATGSSPVRLMLATDVASEGINLHHECHHIIHYDLPWSIITLIQRNGRIDRLGQKKTPELRYLMVNTEEGVIKGDAAIFERLVNKVEEINRLRQSGESVLELYDPKAEEEFIASKGILPGDVDVLEKAAEFAPPEAAAMEAMLREASKSGHDDFCDFLLGQCTTQEITPYQTSRPSTQKRMRLFSDKDFLIEGYKFLSDPDRNPGYQPIKEIGNLIKITAPDDLKRRLGAPDSRGDVIFGATAIPTESWPVNSEFWLTDDPAQVNTAIEAARNTSGYWARELLCSESHPIMQWITERLLMQVKRGEAPYIISERFEPGELCFCFIGQVSSKSGTPLVVDAHAISFHKGGTFKQRSLREALETANFEKMENTGAKPNLQAAQMLIHSAVEQSLYYMRQLLDKRENELNPILIEEERRLRSWRNKRKELLENQIKEFGGNSKKGKRYRLMLEEMNDYLKDREQNWRDTHFTAAREPSTQLLLVIGGKE